MALDFTGVNLIVPTAELADWIEDNISPRDVYEFSYRAWPGRNLTGIAFPEWMERPRIKIGSLWWPRGASRWAVGHFLCSQEQLDLIRPTVYPSSGEPVAGTFSMDSSTADTILTSLYLLPPRPLSQITGLNGHYLLTLVDERYYWWSRSTGALEVTQGTTTWANLYSSIGTALGVTIDADAVDIDYLKPSSQVTARYEALPLVLDSIAYQVGQRIVRKLDGGVKAYNYATSRTRFDTNVATAGPIQAGGTFNFVGL